MFAKMKAILFSRYCIAILFFTALSVLVINYVVTKSCSTIEHIKITGSYQHTAQACIQSAIEPYVRIGFFSLDVQGIQKSLLELPWVLEARISRSWPDTIKVHLTEKVPEAIWNEHWIFDSVGNTFYPEQVEIAKIPKIDGPIDMKRVVFGHYRAIRDQLSPKGLKISQLSMDSRQDRKSVV